MRSTFTRKPRPKPAPLRGSDAKTRPEQRSSGEVQPRFGHDFEAMQVLGGALQRQAKAADAAPAPKVLPAADELTSRIANCIGIWETNRGKNAPAPRESSLETVAGVRASLATIEQATIPYAISALKKNETLRKRAVPPLTLKELNDADARAAAVETLLKAVTIAAAASKAPADFIKDNAPLIAKTGLSSSDVTTMFDAVELKSDIDTAHAAVAAEKTQKDKAAKLDSEIAGIAPEDRLGVGAGSLRTYIRNPKTWGENRAAWQRKAVEAMPDDIGKRIEQVSVSDSGTALAIPTIRARVDAQLAKKPTRALRDIVVTVAQQNNPGEAQYGVHVWETYQRLYGPR